MCCPVDMARRLTIEDLLALTVPEQAALSPDATRCAYVLCEQDTDEDKSLRSIWCVSLADRQPRRLTRGQTDIAPAWSPDGASIAFLRKTDGPAQLWLLPAEGGEPEQLTTLPLGAGAPVWSPDGSKIAFAAATGAAEAARPLVADRLDYLADEAGYVGTLRKHLFVLDVTSKECRQATRGDW